MTKKAISQNIFVRNSTKFLLYAKKSFKEFACDFAVFAIRFSPKFDDIATRHG
jgi:hypothetical protein